MSHAAEIVSECFDQEPTILESCNPNRHGVIALVQSTEGYHVVVEVLFDYGDGDVESETDVYDYHSLEIAKTAYDERRNERADTPNWEAQAQYDEMYGTINGEDAGVVEMRELWGE